MNHGFVWTVLLACPPLILALGSLLAIVARRRGLNSWVITYIRERAKRGVSTGDQPRHLILCIADHFEPGNGDVTRDVARQRLNSWTEQYPRLCQEFRDADGRPPQHTFFYPIDMYDEAELDALAILCRTGIGEVEIHLHHDRDTSENLQQTLLRFKDLLVNRHGLLARDRETGEAAYGFVHGDWALDNSCPGGHACGVNDELDILRQTGCYADFTLPSAPSQTQTRKINSIYYASDDPDQAKSHDWGTDLGNGERPHDGLMLIQGPLVLNWRRRKWGIVPRIENGCLQYNQPPTMDRLEDWLRARVQVRTRPDWYFVKLHTHGAPEGNQRVLLGQPMHAFHKALAQKAQEDPSFHFHYVTAREMYNLARAAEAGWEGTVDEARDFSLVPNWQPALSPGS